MTQKDRELLIRDLCARLPYGIKCSFGVDDAVYEITGINPTCCGASEIQATHVESSINGDFKLNSCKPYLFPLSSITEEQKKELNKCVKQDYQKEYDNFVNNISNGVMKSIPMPNENVIEFYHKNYIDYRGLISKGLVIDATNKNIY